MYDASEALEDPQARHLELLVQAEHPTMGSFRTVRPPVTFDGARTTDVIPPPTLGEHNDEVLGPLRERLATAATNSFTDAQR
jgi:crotonobetainyl-CoA:carnitine CoA-transferase CaiB-like acyl-CoA transferase